MTKNTFDKEVITQPVVPSDLLTGMTIGTLQEAFHLCEADFLRLKAGRTFVNVWAVNVFFITLGFGASIAPKILSGWLENTNHVTRHEMQVLFAGVFLSVILYLIGLLLPNERKVIMTRIEQHFKNAPKIHQLIRDQKC